MTTSSTDNQFGFSAPKVGTSFELPQNPHLDHLLAMTGEALDIISRHDHSPQVDVDNVGIFAQKSASVGVIDPESARSNLQRLFDEQASDYDFSEAA